MAYLDFLEQVHTGTKRDYLARVLAGNKAEFATIAKRFDREYWDGSRNTGYGGYKYDGRWLAVAQRMDSSSSRKCSHGSHRSPTQSPSCHAYPTPLSSPRACSILYS